MIKLGGRAFQLKELSTNKIYKVHPDYIIESTVKPALSKKNTPTSSESRMPIDPSLEKATPKTVSCNVDPDKTTTRYNLRPRK